MGSDRPAKQNAEWANSAFCVKLRAGSARSDVNGAVLEAASTLRNRDGWRKANGEESKCNATTGDCMIIAVFPQKIQPTQPIGKPARRGPRPIEIEQLCESAAVGVRSRTAHGRRGRLAAGAGY